MWKTRKMESIHLALKVSLKMDWKAVHEDRDENSEKKQGIYFAKSFVSLYQQGIATYL